MTAHGTVLDLKARMGRSIVGQEHIIERLLIGLLANGNLLVEGLPGLAKTRAVKSLAEHLDAGLSRIQFTPDLLPSDITGTEVYYQADGTNALWGQRGNYLEVPTDCPQRDERLGWMGDAQVFARTAAYNMDVAAFLGKWLVDVRDAQLPEGAFSNISPRLPDEPRSGAPGWGDAGVIVPWTLYWQYGDRRGRCWASTRWSPASRRCWSGRSPAPRSHGPADTTTRCGLG